MFILYSFSFSFPWTVGVFQTADQVGSMAELARGPAPSSGSQSPCDTGLAFGLGWDDFREELARMRVEAQTTAEGTLASGKPLLLRGL